MPLHNPNITPLILASGSAVRAKMLKQAGLGFTVQTAKVDERVIEDDLCLIGAAPRDIALELAEEKARAVAKENPDMYVIGADQLLVFDGKIHHKCTSLDEAKDRLMMMSGKTHSLISAACIAIGDAILWSHIDVADLKMHDLSDAFIDAYLKEAGDDILSSVACYKLEEYGPWLFDKIDGNFHTILGLPLLPLLNFLRIGESND